MNIKNRLRALAALLLLTLTALPGLNATMLSTEGVNSKLNVEQADPVKLYHSAQASTQMRRAMEDAILDAQDSIVIFTFSFSDEGFMDLLHQKAEEGVDVKVIINKDHQRPLANYAGESIDIFTRRQGEGRVHHKILVVDEEDVWLGSANFSSSAFSTQENFVVQVKSSEIAQALRQEAEVFQGLRKRQDTPAPSAQIGDTEVSLFLLPHAEPYSSSVASDINEKGKDQLLSIIEQAQSSIRIAMMVWTDPELEEAVLAAHGRGVHVEVLLQDMGDQVAWSLKAAGVHVSTNPRSSLMHNKLMWVDEDIFVNGSANWSRSSFSRNDESFLVLRHLPQEQKVFLADYWSYLLGEGQGPSMGND